MSCCQPSSGCCAPSPKYVTPVTHDDVSEYYGKHLQSKDDLLTSACVLGEQVSRETRLLLKNVHPEILDRFYGCGSPIAPLLKGAVVLDLGCGTGRDVYTAAQLVGEEGHVIGLDMTDEQLSVARKHEDWHREKFGLEKKNFDFRKGFIEDLTSAGIEEESVDVVMSNCVINLAPSKEPVLREIWRVLKPGGELYFSDVYADRRIPDHLQKDKILFGECLGGALYVEDFRRLMGKVGLAAWGPTTVQKMSINNKEIERRVGEIQFYSMTVRAVKVPMEDCEDSPEDYGQVATYKGTIPGFPETFPLDLVRKFPKGTAISVDSTTAAMLSSSRYQSAFDVSEKKSHKGPFTLWGDSKNSSLNIVDKFAGEAEGGPMKACC